MPPMIDRTMLIIFLWPAVILAIIIVGGLALLIVRSGGQPEVGLTAAAALESPDGDSMGTVTFRQAEAGVLVMADVNGLAPGGHAFIIHEVGACAPDFSAAGDHFDPVNGDSFNPIDTGFSFIHRGWKRSDPGGRHGGDLPNIYASPDGSARADFLTDGVTLEEGLRHSVFDADGSAIIVHEEPDEYGDHEEDSGSRLACGVITRK